MIHRISPWVSLRHWEVLTLSAKGRTWRLDRSREWPLAAQPRRWLGHRRRTAGHPTGPFGLNLAKDRFGSNSEELRLSVQVRYAADSRKPANRAAFDRHADRSWWRIRCKYWLSLSGDEARETASHGPLSPAGEVSGVARENAQSPRAANRVSDRIASVWPEGLHRCTVARGDNHHTPFDRRQTRRLLPTAVSFATVR